MSQPDFTAWSVVYDTKSATFNDDHVTLATVNGRVTCEYVLPYEDERDATPHGQYFEHESYAPKRATLQYETADEDFYLYVMLARDVDDGERQEAGQRDEVPENGTVLGVDLNATGTFAVTSSGAHIGSADQLTHERQQYERRRGRLQQTGTRSAHLTIQSLGGRFARRSTERLRCWVNELLIESEPVDADGIILEEVTHIRERIGNGEQFQRWAFATFIEIVEYKADAQGLFVAAVDSAYTSQRCSKCGHTRLQPRWVAVFVSGLRIYPERRLQHREERRAALLSSYPARANVSRWMGHLSTGPVVGGAERERRVYAVLQRGGRAGVHRQVLEAIRAIVGC
jgi:putative transposase